MVGVVKMYQKEYERWMAADLEDPDLKPELSKIEGNDDEIKERFAVALKFGTAGLRGVLGAGTNRMNIYVVRQATQGLANWVKTQGGTQTVAISYDSRLKSDVFAKTAAGVLAANGIKVRIYDALMRCRHFHLRHGTITAMQVSWSQHPTILQNITDTRHMDRTDAR